MCEIPFKLVLPSHKISIGEDVLTPHFHRLPHTCYGKTLFFRYWRNLLHQQFTATLTTMLLTWDTRKGDPHSNGLRRFSLIWQWYVMPTSDTTGCFQEHMSICSIVMSVHMIHQYLSECCAVKYPRLVIKQRHGNVFLCIYRLSSAVDDCSTVVMLSVLSLVANIRGCL